MKNTIQLLTLAVATTIPTSLMAQQSGAVGSAENSFPQPRGALNIHFNKRSDIQIGYKIYQRKVVCETCLFPEGIPDRTAAKHFAVNVYNRDTDFKMSSRQRKLLFAYLGTRFGFRIEQ